MTWSVSIPVGISLTFQLLSERRTEDIDRPFRLFFPIVPTVLCRWNICVSCISFFSQHSSLSLTEKAGVKQVVVAIMGKDQRGGDPTSSRMVITQSAEIRTRKLPLSTIWGESYWKLFIVVTELYGVHRVTNLKSLLVVLLVVVCTCLSLDDLNWSPTNRQQRALYWLVPWFCGVGVVTIRDAQQQGLAMCQSCPRKSAKSISIWIAVPRSQHHRAK